MASTVFVLVHSPLVGPSTWEPGADALRRHGRDVFVPALEPAELPATDAPETITAAPFWQRHASAVADALRDVPAARPIVLAGHSGAGSLLPAIRSLSNHAVAAYLFVDAGIPVDGESRLGPADSAFSRQLLPVLEAGGSFPEWSDPQLAPLVPDPERRRALLAGLRPRALQFWTEPLPVFRGWPDAPTAFLHWSAPYAEAAEQARALGWPVRSAPAGHFRMLVDPDAVALDLLALVEKLGCEG